ncbi:hypothetical protein [Methanosarcina mazei]|jgi:nucleoside-triphosphatase THEP1|uniref:Uncharacterized protein n=1 Tax=Methanosarcina mazei TaxID=2209 RepID=A0A0F8SH66_METMZ|nr:hypothetical protein [Methanosarcina mazei]KKF99589.1 hypothetical protein DU31_10235 [Methanosarcina mazei]KKG25700.1 hypothetical protein DU52_01435 [Methanosarcina mazei]KKG36620.1 hypothetical protein DU30_15215 [Methanosarcina mazei]KKH39154.1 hypothetical protein DU50_11130 [Methanosarcina mazei]KKH50764.1 hypothetical protein DU85_06885 [Methanosarcina mazei]
MADELDINQLILETIDERCRDPFVKKLIKKSLQYEIDIWNRNPRKNDIESQYQMIIEKIVREIPE